MRHESNTLMSSLPYGGVWTKKKLKVLGKYLDAYTTALKDQPSRNNPFRLIYIDAFAGPGWWNTKSEYEMEEYGEFQSLHKGSPRIALEIHDKPFDRLMFIEKDPEYSSELSRNLSKEFSVRDINIIQGDANIVIPKICDKLKYMDRAIVFLDPYATEVTWSTVKSIAETSKIDCWILFPLMAISRMMPRKKRPSLALQTRLDLIFGGSHWKDLYGPASQQSFFDEKREERPIQNAISELYHKQLNSIFEKVAPTRGILCNSQGSTLFELLFAASNPTGANLAVKIADHLLTNW